MGRIGQFYSHVESNNKAKEFVAFINACATFQKCVCSAIDELKKLDPQQPCLLEGIVGPLRCISAYLRPQVVSIEDSMQELSFYNDTWYITTQHDELLLHSMWF